MRQYWSREKRVLVTRSRSVECLGRSGFGEKKRGGRRTGSRLLGSVSEASFFGILLFIGATILCGLLIAYLTDSAPYQAWAIWTLVVVSISLFGIGVGGVARSLFRVGTSIERQSAIVRKAQDIELLAEKLPTEAELSTIPRQVNLTNSPGIHLAFRLPMLDSPGSKLLATGLFAICWNGLLGVVALLAVQSYVQGHANWFLLLFTIPFALIGYKSVVWFFRLLRRMSSIGPTNIEISHLPLQPGQSYTVFVSQAGRLSVKSFSVSLVCEEHAVFREGTDVRTEEKRVYEQQIARRTNVDVTPDVPIELQEEFRLPENVMHSFRSSHNAIQWRLVVVGKTVRWSRFERAFPVVVYPRVSASHVSHVRGSLSNSHVNSSAVEGL